MFKNIANFFNKRVKMIESELILRNKMDEIIGTFVKENISGSNGPGYNLSYTMDKGIIKIKTDNKMIAQEIALRIRYIEDRLRKEKLCFKKLLI